MRRRLYFLLPDTATARRVVDELLLERIEERHMHFMARAGTDLTGLPTANLAQRSDLVHGLSLGLVLGGLTGTAVGIALMAAPPAGLSVGGGLVLACALAGALIGAWGSSMIATSVPNTRLQSFEQAMEAGQVLLMVDVPKARVADINALIKRHHPEAGRGGVEPTIPAFP